MVQRKLAAMRRWKSAMTVSQEFEAEHSRAFGAVVQQAQAAFGREDKLDALRRCPALRGLPDAVLERLAGCMRGMQLSANAKLAHAGTGRLLAVLACVAPPKVLHCAFVYSFTSAAPPSPPVPRMASRFTRALLLTGSPTWLCAGCAGNAPTSNITH